MKAGMERVWQGLRGAEIQKPVLEGLWHQGLKGGHSQMSLARLLQHLPWSHLLQYMRLQYCLQLSCRCLPPLLPELSCRTRMKHLALLNCY